MALTRCISRQKTATTLNLLAYYIIALPVGLALCYNWADMGLLGLNAGFLFGDGALIGCLAFMLEHTDWQEKADELQA